MIHRLSAPARRLIDGRSPALALLWSLVGLTLLGFGLRVVRLGHKAVWWDEGLAAWAARQSLAEMSRWTAHDVHPPLYFWLLHFWRLASGDSEFGLRLLSALIGAFTIPVAFLLGRAVGGRRVGLLAALLLALSRFGIAWSQEMRMYALAALLAALALWATVRVWNRGGRRDWLAYILTMSAGLYTLYLSVSVLLVANLTWLLLVWPRRPDRRRSLWRWAAGQTAVLLLFAPWLLYALGRIPTWTSASPVSPLDFLKIYWTVLVTGIVLNVEQHAAVTLPVLVIFLAGLATIWRGAGPRARRDAARRDAGLLLLGLLLPALLVYAVSIPKESFFYAPQIAPRYLIIFLAAYVVLLAWGVVRLADRWRASGPKRARGLPLFLSLLVVAATLYGLRGYHRGRVLIDDYKSLARTLAVTRRPEDAVVLVTDTDWPIFAYHYPAPWRGVPHAWHITPAVAADYLAPIWAAHEAVWLVLTPYAGVSDPAGELAAWLADRATAVSSLTYGDKTLRLYARTPARSAVGLSPLPGAAPQVSLRQNVAPAGRLLGYDQATTDAAAGDAVYLALYWQAPAGAPAIEVGLIDPRGRAWGAVVTGDLLPAGASGLQRQPLTITVPPDAPAGDYRFYLFDRGGKSTRLGALAVRQRSGPVLLPADVTMAYRLDVDFGDNIRLLGYDLDPPGGPGSRAGLTLYWQAQAPVSGRYKVFTHLLGDVYNADGGSFLWGQQDNEPVNATRPTTGWRPGEVIVDGYAIPVAAAAPPGSYRLEIGLYDPATGVRLPLADGAPAADHLILTTIDLPPAD